MKMLYLLILSIVTVSSANVYQRKAELGEEFRLNMIEEKMVAVLKKNEMLLKDNLQLKNNNDDLESRVSRLEDEMLVLLQERNQLQRIDAADGLTNTVDAKRESSEVNAKGSPKKRQLLGETVAFTAVLTPAHVDIGPGQTIVFDHSITNVGGAYHTTTGIFTAPVSGVYVFNFAAMEEPGHYEYLEIVKDGSHVMWNYPHGAGETHYVSASRTTTLELNKGNEIWIRSKTDSSHGTGAIHGNTFSTFSGWLIAITE